MADLDPGERLRLEAYRKIADATTPEALEAVRAELVDRYGPVPEAVENLFEVAGFRNTAREVGLTDVTAQGRYVRFAPVELPESAQLRLTRLYPGTILKPAIRTALVPFPTTARIGGHPLAGKELLRWARDLVAAICRWVLVPSLAVVLVTGLLAIAATRGYHSAGWAWVKAATAVRGLSPAERQLLALLRQRETRSPSLKQALQRYVSPRVTQRGRTANVAASARPGA